MSAPEYIEYTITKTGENAYSMTITPKLARYVNIQKNIVHLKSEDVDGTKTVHDVELPPAAISTWNSSTSFLSPSDKTTLNSGGEIDGFKVVDTTNLAVGGVCYEIDSIENDDE